MRLVGSASDGGLVFTLRVLMLDDHAGRCCGDFARTDGLVSLEEDGDEAAGDIDAAPEQGESGSESERNLST